ncbi:MAG: hypothetical protein WCR74_17635 [Betaproteobacteria bacterium]
MNSIQASPAVPHRDAANHKKGVRNMRSRLVKTLALSIAALGMAPSAFAILDRAGPVDPVNGFPQWYLDRNGVALELCVNNDAAVLAAGGCVVLPGPVPAGVQTVPEVFVSNWATEHFYTLASAKLPSAGVDKVTGVTTPATGLITFNLGLEGSFSNGVPTVGTQVAFSRWRVQHVNVGCDGNYTYYTPNRAPQTYAGAAGGKIFQTADVGIGNFNGPLAGTTGPFLQWSATAGGPVKPPFIGPDGKKYISNYTLIGTPVTGSELANPLRASTKAWIPAEIKAMPFANYALVEGPGISTGNCAATEAVYTTNSFQLFGRLFEGPIPSINQVDRATYKAVDTNADGTPDAFQVGVWATVTQKPNGPVPVVGMSLYQGDPVAPTTLTPELAMTRQALPNAVGAQPKFEFFQGTTAAKQVGATVDLTRPSLTHARARINSDVPSTFIDQPLVDELRISQAIWDSAAKTLSVTAESGAFLAALTPTTQTAANVDCSAPCLKIDPFGLPAKDAAGAAIDFKLNTIPGEKFAILSTVIPNVHVPPAFITVNSSNGGSDTQPVIYAGAAAGSAILQADFASTALNTAVTIPVLANDIGVALPPALQICTAATGGICGVPSPTVTCVANTASPSCTISGARLSITANNQVVYTPRANLGGLSETFWYQANTITGAPARGQVTVTVGNLAGLPDARDDLGLQAVATIAATFNVTANDFAPAPINRATLRFTQTPCNNTLGVCDATAASFNALGRLVFTAPSAGAWTLGYTWTDVNGVAADPAVVTVNVDAGETLNVVRFLWRAPAKPGQLGTISGNGTSSISAGQPIIVYLPNAATGPNGCDFPTLGTRIAATTVVPPPPVPAWVIGATALTTRPATAYAYSPTYRSCTQAVVQ